VHSRHATFGHHGDASATKRWPPRRPNVERRPAVVVNGTRIHRQATRSGMTPLIRFSIASGIRPNDATHVSPR